MRYMRRLVSLEKLSLMRWRWRMVSVLEMRRHAKKRQVRRTPGGTLARPRPRTCRQKAKETIVCLEYLTKQK